MTDTRSARYTVVGRQNQPFERMSVRSNVTVPSAEACEYGAPREGFTAGAHKGRRRITLSLTVCVLLCAVTLFFCGMKVLLVMSERASVQRDIAGYMDKAREIARENESLKADVESARDATRVCYAAANELGMEAPEGVNTIYLIAPSTR